MAKKKKTKQSRTSTPQRRADKAIPPALWAEKWEVFFRRHFSAVVVALFLFSLGISSTYFVQSHKSPLESLYKWKNSDMAFFDSWAKYLAKGNWMCDTILHPFHDWHEKFAADYFAAYPEVAATYYGPQTHDGIIDSLAARKDLINVIYKGKTFHQEPLYTYMLAATFAVFGHKQNWVYAWQVLLAALTSVLVFLIGKRIFGYTAGLLGALFMTLCATITVFEMVLLRTTLTNFLTALLLYVYLRVKDNPSRQNYIFFGLSSGISLLAQSYFILFLFPAWAYLAWSNRHQWKQLAGSLAIYIGALLFIMSPLIYRNLHVGVPPFAMAGHGAMAYIPMNTRYSYPMESFSIHYPSMVRIRHEGDGHMIPTAIKCLGTFQNFSQFWEVYSQKINGMFMWYELPNNMSYYLFREFASILKILPVHYSFIAPLGLAGLVLGFYRYRWKMIPFFIMVVACVLPLFIAGNLARYRTPLVIMLCLTAAFFLWQTLQWIWQRNWKHSAIALGGGLAFFLYTSSLVPKHRFTINTNDLDPMYVLHYANDLRKLEQSGDTKAYLKLTTELMGYIPRYFYSTTVGDKVWADNEAASCKYVAGLFRMHAQTLELEHQDKDAAYFYERSNVLTERANAFYQSVRKQ